MPSLDDDNTLVALGTKIPNRTRRRLDGLKDAGHPVNISETCSDALAIACDRSEIEAGLATAEVVAERLKDALLLGTHREDSNRGFVAGQRWARLNASPLQLAIIECEILPQLRDGSYCYEPGNPWLPYAIFFDINLESYNHAPTERAIDFWKAMMGDPLSEVSMTFAWSFVDGAEHEWREAKRHFFVATRDINLDIYGFNIREIPPPEVPPEGIVFDYVSTLITELRVKPPRNARSLSREVSESVPESTPKKSRKQRD